MLAELDELAQALAVRVRRAVAIDDPTMRLLVHTPHHGAVDETRMQSILHLRADSDVVAWVLEQLKDRDEDVFRLPASPERGTMSRVCAPLRDGGRTLGYLWLIDEDESLTQDQLQDVAEVGRAASRIMARGGMPQDTRLVWEQSLTEDLFLPEAGIREMAARSLASLTGFDGPVQCVVFTVPTPAGERVEDAYRALRRAAATHSHLRCLTLVEDGIGTVVVPATSTAGRATAALTRSARKELAALGRDRPVRSAAGDPVPGLEQAHSSRRQALATLRVVQQTGEFGAHAQWADIGAYRLLVHIDTLATLDELLPDGLVVTMSSPSAVDILETVEVYLDHGGDVQASVRALSVHRTSLYYRLKRFGEVSGMDLRDGQVRLTVHAAIKLARLSGWRPGQVVPGLGTDRP